MINTFWQAPQNSSSHAHEQLFAKTQVLDIHAHPEATCYYKEPQNSIHSRGPRAHKMPARLSSDGDAKLFYEAARVFYIPRVLLYVVSTSSEQRTI